MKLLYHRLLRIPIIPTARVPCWNYKSSTINMIIVIYTLFNENESYKTNTTKTIPQNYYNLISLQKRTSQSSVVTPTATGYWTMETLPENTKRSRTNKSLHNENNSILYIKPRKDPGGCKISSTPRIGQVKDEWGTRALRCRRR